jgi:hypothetical protein
MALTAIAWRRGSAFPTIQLACASRWERAKLSATAFKQASLGLSSARFLEECA